MPCSAVEWYVSENRPWAVETADQVDSQSLIERDLKDFSKTFGKLSAPASTASDIIKGDRTSTTTRQIRRRTRLGGEGRDVVEEKQEVIVRTTVTRWTGAAAAETIETAGDGRVEDKGVTEQRAGNAAEEVLIDGNSIKGDAQPEEPMQVDA
jgi:hypothetical protein